jgi:uncharacterized membrane protein
VDGIIEPLQKKFPLIDIPGIGFVVVIVLIFLVGFLASNLIGRRLIAGGESLFNRLPLVSKIFTASKELSEVLLGGKKAVFKRVVLIRFPHHDSWGLGFEMNDGVSQFDHVLGEESVVVFVPTTPNPTSGFMIVVPRRESFPVDISVEDAVKMALSGGAFKPQPYPAAPYPRSS